MKIREHAFAEFVDTLLIWEADIVTIVQTNQAMTRISARKHKNIIMPQCYISRHEFVKNNAKGLKVCNYDHITG